MQSVQNKSKLRIIVIVAVVMAALVIVGGAVFAFTQVGSDNQKQEEAANQQSNQKVTQETIQRGMDNVNKAAEQTTQAHSIAKDAVANSKNQVKVSQ